METSAAEKSGRFLGIISDTHGEVETTRRAYEEFARRGVERVLHCGDVGAPEKLGVFRAIPTDFVLGNCDKRRKSELESAIPAVGGRLWGVSGRIEWAGKRIFWTHGDLERLVEDETYSELWDLICVGHTHSFKRETYKSTIILNPGGIQPKWEAPSCCVVDERLDVERIVLPTSRTAAFFE